MHGTLRWINRAKGYGFVAREDGGDDLFARLDPQASLAAGDPVSFAMIEGAKGPEAIDVVPGHVPGHGEN
ncbi:MAG: cold-shock protein [Alphaproteobacteria bacterium]|nr:cold-shock protein [Alphaproteobacteria bacterium]